MAVICVKKRTVELVSKSRKLIDSCNKRQSKMPTTENLVNQASSTISRNGKKEPWISDIELPKAYVQKN